MKLEYKKFSNKQTDKTHKNCKEATFFRGIKEIPDKHGKCLTHCFLANQNDPPSYLLIFILN